MDGFSSVVTAVTRAHARQRILCGALYAALVERLVPAGVLIVAFILLARRIDGQAASRIAEADAARLARVDSIFAPFARPDAPGYSVGIIQRGRLVYARGFGSANLDFAIPISAATVFNVASLSKQFTAACIGILIRRGSLSLEDDVKRYIPDFPDYPAPIRIKHLVYMTSGLPEYYTLRRPNGQTWDLDYFTIEDAIRVVLREPRLLFVPGTRWAYSNTNYMLLTTIVQRVSGLPFAEFAQREIFGPLGMTSSHVNVDLGVTVRNRATGYNARPLGGYQQEIRRSPHFGGSGLFTSVEDLARWDRSFETHALGGPELTSLLLSTMRFDHDKMNDAFGLVWGKLHGLRTIWYEGGDVGFSSYMIRFPDERFTIVVLSNLGAGRAGDYARRIADVFVVP